MSARYIPVRIGTFRPSQAVEFDVYIQVGERKLHYIRKSDAFDGDRIQRLQKKGVKKLFISSEAEPDYLHYLDQGLDGLKDTSANLEVKATIAREGLLNAAESAVRSVETQAAFQQTERQVTKILEFLTSDQGAVKQLLSSGGFSEDVYQHSSQVVALSVELASRVGIQDPAVLLQLGMAALLHDIGKEGLELDHSVPREQLSGDALARYQTHPERALEKIADKPYINRKVVELILNHEELGEEVAVGFPGKKRLSTLSQEQQVLNLCNEYDRICTVNRVAPLDAIKQFYVDKMGLFPLELLNTFSQMIRGARV